VKKNRKSTVLHQLTGYKLLVKNQILSGNVAPGKTEPDSVRSSEVR